MYYSPHPQCYSGGYGTFVQQQPTKVQQLTAKYPDLSNQLAVLAQNIKNNGLTVDQALGKINGILSQIPVPTVGATLRGAACILSAVSSGKMSSQEALSVASDAVQNAANALISIKNKYKPS